MFRAWIPTYILLVLITACAQTVQSELRIILVGRTGSGKSDSGNTIFGKEVFKNNFSRKDVCQWEEGEDGNGRYISIVNTQGLFDGDESLKREMLRCTAIHSFPGPHAFLFVINVKAGLTEEERAGVKWIEDNFGSDASMYTILLFTHTDELGGKSLEEYISESEDLRRLRNQCGGRYHAFNKQLKDKSQVNQLLKKIEEMVEGNGKKHYTNDKYREVQEGFKKVWDYNRGLNKYKGRALQIGGRGVDKISEADKAKCRKNMKSVLAKFIDLILTTIYGIMYMLFGFSPDSGFDCIYNMVFEDFLKFYYT